MAWMTLKQAAAYTGLHPDTLIAHIKDNSGHPLPARLIGRRWLIEQSQLDEWIRTYPQPLPKVDIDRIVDDVLKRM
jgi:excisionase family DNA binding protein